MHGLWWRPDAPNEKHVGKLTIKPGQTPKLVLFIKENAIPFASAVDVLHGTDDGGKPVTLYRLPWSRNQSGGELVKVSMTAGKVFEGAHILKPAEELFHRIDFSLQRLHAWAGRIGFVATEQVEKGRDIKYRLPEDETFALPSGWTVTLFSHARYRSKGRSESVEEDHQIKIERDTPFTFSEGDKLLHFFRGLIHFSCLDKVQARSITVRRPGDVHRIGTHTLEREIPVRAQFCHADLEREMHKCDFIFRFPDIRDRFGDLIHFWFEFCEKFSESLGCYYNTVYNRLTSPLELVALTQALESFHSVDTGKSVHFIERIEALLAAHASRTAWAFSEDLAELAKIIRDNRNYYTHHDPKILVNGRVLEGGDLHYLNEKLTVLFRLAVLDKLGITSDPYGVIKRHYPTLVVSY